MYIHVCIYIYIYIYIFRETAIVFVDKSFFKVTIDRSSPPEVFCEKGFYKNFAEFIEKHLCESSSFNKVASLGPETFLKKRLWHRCFPVNFAKFLRKPFI